MKEKEHFKVVIENNETIVERDWSYINYKGELSNPTRTVKSKNTEGDIYDRRIGIIVAILKSLGFSRRIISKISNILLEENKRYSI